LAALRGLAEDSSVTVRSAAVQALAQRQGAGFAGQLETLAQDEDWRLRLAAANAAAELKGAGRPVLNKLVEDPDTRVLTAALQGLVASGDAASEVEKALTADDLAVRGTAVLLVPQAGLSDPLVSLGRALEASTGDAWVEIREGVVDALVQVEGGEALLTILAQEDPASSVRRRARTALAQRDVSVAAAPATDPPGPSPLLGQAPEEDVRVVLATSRGDLVLRVLASEAPVHAANFLDLVDRGFYDGLLWHRVVSNFVIQGGDPRGDGWGSGERTLRDEINPVPFNRGTVGMPKAGKDTGGCQIFITHLPTPHLDGNYTVFGQVEEGLEVIDLLEVGDRIESARRL
jgi:cyclophilin family peptidyl-prolyl cis-trans isomerase